ncbi:hypothetical protein EPUS_01988 [Endocarpon pusillum Z07020]|uniref:Uncharacterized protein n=1 Tax=Endocarpon pusillum (strain Z07020 / HMAS-L-300199) TaxID=1263415 RepID=U1GQP9_ENDPU|nr:uncharacterized protein EPUS_01988 [Endocarpon pusillum Z07020]ERF74301.1 hypothetical protein EPUS_01988 [Endocarpon pusillum Z07020]
MALEPLKSTRPGDENIVTPLRSKSVLRGDDQAMALVEPTLVHPGDDNMMALMELMSVHSRDDISIVPVESRALHPKEDRFTDSGYGSAVGSPRTDEQGASAQTQPQTEPNQGFNAANQPKPTIVGATRGLKKFEKEVDQSIIDRFQDVVERLEGPLFEYMRKSWRQPRPTAIRLMVLGKDEGDARPWIVVLCSQDQSKRIKRFFQQKFAKAVYCPEGPAEQRFEVLVIGQPPRPKAANASPEMFDGLLSPALERIKITSCGTMVKLSVQDHVRFATLGGIIKVVNTDGSYNLYGLTAGHILDPPEASIESDQSDTSSELDEDEFSDEEDYLDEVRSNTDIFEHHSDLNEDLNSSLRFVQNPKATDTWSKLGTISLGSRQVQGCNRDWALIESIEPKFYRPNYLVGEVNNSQHRCKDLQEPTRDKTAMRAPRKVVVNSESCSPKLRQGVLSKLPTMLMLPPARKFVRVYPLSMDYGSGIIHGDSGAWVVNDSSLEVYGHIVAGDTFGEVYVVPLWDTFDDIRREMNATSVSLATSVDILCHTSETVEKKAKSSEMAGKDTSTLNLKGSLYACTLDSPVEEAQPSSKSFEDLAKMSQKTSSDLPIQCWGQDSPLPNEDKSRSEDSGYCAWGSESQKSSTYEHNPYRHHSFEAYDSSPNQIFGNYPYGAHGPTLRTNQPHNQSLCTSYRPMSSLNMCLGHQPYGYPPLAYPPHGFPDSLIPFHGSAPLPISPPMPLSQPDSGYASNPSSMSGSPVPIGKSCSPPRAPSCVPRPVTSLPQSGQHRRQMPESRDIVISSRESRGIKIKAPTQAFSEEQQV